MSKKLFNGQVSEADLQKAAESMRAFGEALRKLLSTEIKGTGE